jgi:hypothetical protein
MIEPSMLATFCARTVTSRRRALLKAGFDVPVLLGLQCHAYRSAGALHVDGQLLT